MTAECLRKDFPNKVYYPKQTGKDQLDDLITLRIFDGIVWNFTQAKWWMWWKTVKCGGLISSCCPRNQDCSRDRLVRDQDRDRKIFPRTRPVSISILASRPRPAKFETKTETETEKMTLSIVFSIFWKKVFEAHICSWVGFMII